MMSEILNEIHFMHLAEMTMMNGVTMAGIYMT